MGVFFAAIRSKSKLQPGLASSVDSTARSMDFFRKKSKPKDKGHVLGSGEQRSAVYVLEFREQTLGFTIAQDERGDEPAATGCHCAADCFFCRFPPCLQTTGRS